MDKLIKWCHISKLLLEINRQLEKHNLKVRYAYEAIVDATLITSNVRPRKIIDLGEAGNSNKVCSADINVSWEKGRKNYFVTEKVSVEFTMKAICFNLLKDVNKIQIA